MPRLISFMLTRLLTGFSIGVVVGVAVWINGLSPIGSSLDGPESYMMPGLFIYLFGSTIGVGYLATALFLDDL
jgi:hypothetical protein